jgi:oxygen-dependent protoporphyrinogen oxidase
MSMKKILIIGAGISGLTAAYRLRLDGHDVTVVESGNAPGGWVQTDQDSHGGRIEKGPQLMAVEAGTPLHLLLCSLEIPLTTHRHLSRFIGIDGRLMRVPRNLLEFLKSPLLTLQGKLRIFLEPFLYHFVDKGKEYTLHEAIEKRFGFEAANRLAPALVNGILAVPASEVSQESFPIFSKSNDRSLLWESIKRGSTILATPSRGMGQLTQVLASKCTIVFNTEITTLEYRQQHWHASGASYYEKFDSIFLATAAHKAATLLTSISPRLSSVLRNIEYTSLHLCHSTHSYNKTLDDSLGFLLHPNESEFLLGCFVSSSLEPLDKSKTLKLRTFIKANQSPAPNWQDIYSELLKWLPDLSPCAFSLIETALLAIPKLQLGQSPEIITALKDLPMGLDWIGGARFGPGVKDIVEGIDSWMKRSDLEA